MRIPEALFDFHVEHNQHKRGKNQQKVQIELRVQKVHRVRKHAHDNNHRPVSDHHTRGVVFFQRSRYERKHQKQRRDFRNVDSPKARKKFTRALRPCGKARRFRQKHIRHNHSSVPFPS